MSAGSSSAGGSRATQPFSQPLALTMGEPAGIGGEITLKAWRRKKFGAPSFFVIDNCHRLEAIAQALALDVPIHKIETADEAVGVFAEALPVLDHPVAEIPQPGEPLPANAKSVLESIKRAVELVRRGDASAVVTNPIHKLSLYDAGFDHPGHTEYLAVLSNSETTPVMMLACDQLKTVLVSIHVGLRQAIDSLTTEAIVKSGTIAAKALVRDFGIREPRLAVAGLNPHAGENGAMGSEEMKIITPAVAKLREVGIEATGPYSPDAMFSPRLRGAYDAAVCMYHDQALIPIKTLDFDGAVNVTLGLSLIRTSPDHGTAFDIAGSGQASEASLVAAIRLAAAMAKQRAAP